MVTMVRGKMSNSALPSLSSPWEQTYNLQRLIEDIFKLP